MDKKFEPIAIIGIGVLVPDANNKEEFWQNIITGKDSITEVPISEWDPKLYYSQDHNAEGKTYSKIGAFIKNYKFNSIKYRIPPAIAKQMDMMQQYALDCASQALTDSGYDKKDFNKNRTAVIAANTAGGPSNEYSDMRIYEPLIEQAMKTSNVFQKLPAQEGDELIKNTKDNLNTFLPITNEDSMPGQLPNVIAGRIANVFNLRGASMAVDGACASSLLAIDTAINGLRLNKYDMALCVATDRMVAPSHYVKFSKIGALSADGSRPFDDKANGFVMGEGAGAVILKRLSDAKKDGDKIYALIRSVGLSSDGKGKGITAPNPEGQKLAILNAFEGLEFKPQDINLLEAHGTATKVGDSAEMKALNEVFSGAKVGSIALGSIKSQIGHTKANAGMASLIKTTLALHNKILPPSINFDTPSTLIDWANSPFKVNTIARTWEKQGKTRLASVSAFGFGGTNAHLTMQEYDENFDFNLDQETKETKQQILPEGKMDYKMLVPQDKLLGDMLVFSADTKEELFSLLNEIAKNLKEDAFYVVKEAYKNHIAPRKKFAVSINAENTQKLKEKIAYFIKISAGINPWEQSSLYLKMKGIYPFHPNIIKPKVCFMFPGQGAQYVDMMKDLASKYKIVRDTFEEADKISMKLANVSLTEVIWSKDGEDKAKFAEREAGIQRTEITQPAILTANVAMMRLLYQFGIKPDVTMGHSLGEYGAAVAAGILSFEDALKAVTMRGSAMASLKGGDNGKMAAVTAPVEKVEPELKKIAGYVAVANKNCPTQTVIAGETKSVDDAINLFNSIGMRAVGIPVSHAFHSKIVRPATTEYRKFLDTLTFHAPQLPITSNVSADFYPNDIQAIKDTMVEQIMSSVEWIKQVELAYQRGVRLFIEIGPKRILSAFVTNTLSDKKDIYVLASNHPKRGGITEFNDLMANLAALGIDVDWSKTNFENNETLYNPAFENLIAPKPQIKEQVETKQEVITSNETIVLDNVNCSLTLTKEQAENLLKLLSKKLGQKVEIKPQQVQVAETKQNNTPTIQNEIKPATQTKQEQVNKIQIDEDTLTKQVVSLMAQKTGYPEDMLELDLDMEADLGIDTVKQAEMLVLLQEKYGIKAQEGLVLKDYPTIRHCIKYIMSNLGNNGQNNQTTPQEQVQEKQGKIEQAQVAETKQNNTPTIQNEVKLATETKQEQVSKIQIDEDTLTKQVVSLMAQKTGYPEDMLELDLDMEADLGIDTVKQAEMLVLLQEKYGIKAQEGLVLKDYPTIRHCIKYIMNNLGGHEPTNKQQESSEKKPEDSEPAHAETKPETLPEQNKEVEQEKKQEIKEEEKQETINNLEENTNNTETIIPTNTNVENVEKTENIEDYKDKNFRYIPCLVDAPLTAESKRILSPQRLILIFSDNGGLTKAYSDTIKLEGLKTHIFTTLSTRGKNVTVVNWNNLEETETILTNFAKENQNKVQGIIYLLPCSLRKYDKRANPHEDLTNYVMPLFLACKIFLNDLSYRENANTFLATIFRSESALGTNNQDSTNPINSAVLGAVNCLRKDLYNLGGVLTKILDFDLNATPEMMAQKTLLEVLKGDERALISYQGDNRKTLFFNPSLLDKKEPFMDLNGKTIVITGAGRGLGSILATEIAKKYKCRFVLVDNIILLDKTAYYATASQEELNNVKMKLWEQLKSIPNTKATPVMLEKEFSKITDSICLFKLIQKLQALGNTVDHLQVDFSNGLKIREAITTIKSRYGRVDGIFHFAGFEHSKFFTDKSIQEYYKTFDIKATSAAAFSTLNFVKDNGFYAFASSIVGKIGNLGQSDYATANGYLNNLANCLSNIGIRAVSISMSAFNKIGMSSRENVQKFLTSQEVEFINPEYGMALFLDEVLYGKRPEIILSGKLGQIDWDHQLRIEEDPAIDNFESQKIEEQSLKSNIPEFLQDDINEEELEQETETLTTQDIIENTEDKNNEIITNSNKEETDSQIENTEPTTIQAPKETLFEQPAPLPANQVDIIDTSSEPEDNFFIGKVIEKSENRILTEKVFEPAYPFFNDHRINETPVLPGVMGIEGFAEITRLLTGAMPKGFEHVHFYTSLKLLRDRPQKTNFEIQKVGDKINVELKSDFVNKDGIKLGATRHHFVADTLQDFTTNWTNYKDKLNLDEQNEEIISKEEIYTTYKFFHGPSMQVLGQILKVNENEVLAVYNQPVQPLFHDGPKNLITNPLLIEAMFQTCGFRDVAVEHHFTLPDYISKLCIYHPDTPPQDLYVYAVYKGKSLENKSVYDAFIFNEDRVLWAELNDFQMINPIGI